MPTQDCVLGRIRKRECGAWQHAPPACRGWQASATILVRPRHVHAAVGSAPIAAALSYVPCFAAPAVLAAARRSLVPPDDTCSPFLPDPRRSLGSALCSEHVD